MRRLLFNRRVLLSVFVVGALLAVAVWPRATEIETAVVTRGPLMETIDEEGETRVRNRYVLTAPVSGEVLRIDLEPGDRVERGMVLATVRAAPPVPLDARTRAETEAAILSARAALGRLTAERDRAETTLRRVRQQTERTRTLAEAGAVAPEELEARDAELQMAQEAVQAAEFAVAQAQHDIDAASVRLAPPSSAGGRRDYTVTSPVDGVVLRRHRESQSVVPAGEPLLEVGDPNQLEIVADLLSADAVAVAVDSEVLIERWGGEETLRGRVRRIEPAGFTKISALGVEEQRVNVIIDFETPSEAAHSLGDGYRVDVRIVTWRADSVQKLPPGALFRQGNDWAVYVVNDGVADVRPVTVGHRSDTEAEITSGVDAGETVVLFPPDTLQDGAKVTVRVN
jgi:HlyD family secretion protein